MSVDMDYYNTGKGKFIELFSNPEIVRKKAKEYGVKVVFSPRKNKKYRIVNPETNKYQDFGSLFHKDFTLTGDLERRRLFRLRNHKWKDAPKYSSAWASYYILWD